MGHDVILHYETLHPTADRPLQGMTVLVVEDSRYASEAIRLLCLRSGARIRRANTLEAAHRHLAVYRPTIVIVDEGLPDGSGAELIGELAADQPRVPVLIGMSGDPASEDLTLQAGADGFLEKPVENLALFQQTILAHLPEEDAPHGPRILPDEIVVPNSAKLDEDLEHLAGMIRSNDVPTLTYATQFLGTIAKMAHDPVLEAAAHSLTQSRAEGGNLHDDALRVAGIVDARLAQARSA
jgi:CheY-like chemotaxis protein